MESQRVEYILQKGEGLTREFKRAASALPNNLFETVCAFLNRNGGTILLGITDEGEVCGVDENKIEQICKNLTNLSNNSSKLDPVFLLQPSIVSLGPKKIIHVFVPSSSQVHKTNGKCYDRGMDGVRYYLKKLKNKGIIHRKGSTKGGEWIVLKKKLK